MRNNEATSQKAKVSSQKRISSSFSLLASSFCLLTSDFRLLLHRRFAVSPFRRFVSLKRRGFTMMEMTASFAIISILVVAIASVLTLASRALPSLNASTSTTVAATARSAMDQMIADAKMATSLTTAANSLTMTVPDRNNDGNSETIVYSWTGVAGDPLLRQYNGGTPLSIADNVQSLSFAAVTKTVGTAPVAPPPPLSTPVESAEQILASYDGSGPIAAALTSTTWPGQYFKPALPSNAISWKITKVRLKVLKTGNKNSFSVNVLNADAAGKPTGSALASVSSLVTSAPSSIGWVEYAYSTLSGLDPAKGYVVTISTTSTSTSINYYYQATAAPPASMMTCYTVNSGGAWSTPSSADSLEIYVYGTVTTQDP